MIEKLKKYKESMQENLVFGSLILILNESIIQLTMTALLFIYSPEIDTSTFDVDS